MLFRKALGILALMLIGLIGVAHKANAQAASPLVMVIPTARSAAFEYRLDLVPGKPWSVTDTSLWVDKNHRATLEWRQPGETVWKQAMDFVRVTSRSDLNPQYFPMSDPRLATMLFGLQEGKTYEYRVTVFAPGYPADPVTGTFTTLTTDVPAGSGKTVTLDPPAGDYYTQLKAALGDPESVNAGATILFKGNVDSTGKPVPTLIRKQIAAIYDPVTSQGVFKPFSWSGTPTAWLTMGVAPGHDVTFDGSDPTYDVKGAGLWEPVPNGTTLTDFTGASISIPSSAHIYRTKNPVVYDRPVQCMYYETERGASAWRLLWFSAIPTTFTSSNGALAPGLRGRWLDPNGGGDTYQNSNGISDLLKAAQSQSGAFCHHTDGRLYVYLQGGKDPETVYIKIPFLNSPLDIQPIMPTSTVHNVKVVGLKIQYFRGPWFGVNVQYEPKNEQGGISIGNADGVVFQDCVLKGVGSGFCQRCAASFFRRNLVIKRCTVTQRGIAPEYDSAKNTWVGPKWGYVKLSLQEGIAISLCGRGMSILDSTIEGWNDAVTPGGGNDYPVSDYSGNQAAYCEGMEVDNCTFRDIVDDCFEPTDYNVCVAATNNTMRRSYKGCSIPRAQGGPLYFIRNRWLGQGEYVAFADRQAPTKLGHPSVPDTAYKFIANNTFVNNYVPQTGVSGTQTLVGLSGSGNSYNLSAINNYVACDGDAVDWPYGALGYDHIFDYNVYIERHAGQQPSQYSASWGGSWATHGVPLLQGDDPYAQNGNAFRYYKSFQSWQMGRNDHGIGTNMPGYTGAIPGSIVETTTVGCNYYATNFPAQKVRWMHDSHGHAYDNQAYDLVGYPTGAGAPVNGMDLYESFDFHPKTGGYALSAGTPIPNITFNCGPAWAADEEGSKPTAGAYPGTSGASKPHLPPTVTVTAGVPGYPNEVVNVPLTYSASEGAIATVTVGVTAPDGTVISSDLANKTGTSATVVFTPPTVGSYTIVATVVDDRGASASAQGIVAVTPKQLPGGSITVSITPSKTDGRPGEPIAYTVLITNPTSRKMTGVFLKQYFPQHVTLNTASAMLDGKPIGIAAGNGFFSVYLLTMLPNTQHKLTFSAVIN